MVYYKLLVTRLKKNIHNAPKRKQDGSVEQEIVRTPVTRVIDVPLEIEGKEVKDPSGNTITKKIQYEDIEEVTQDIIPDYIEDKQYFAYQELPDDELQVVRVLDDKGIEEQFDHDNFRYEMEVIERNIIPTW